MSSPISGLNFKQPVPKLNGQNQPPGQQSPPSPPSLSDAYSQAAQAALKPKKK